MMIGSYYVTALSNTDDTLYHHGIKGQQWGIKHGPPYPIDREKPLTIKKGSTFSHVTNTKKLKLDNRGIYTFDPNDSHDSDVYKGAYATGLKMRNIMKTVYEQRFTNVQDLKMPSHKDKIDTFINILSDNTSNKLKNGQTLESYLDEYADKSNARLMYIQLYNPKDYESKKVLYDSMIENGRNWIQKRDMEAGYKLFMGNFAVKKEMKSATDKFVKELEKKGYNAMIDDLDSGRYNGANAPIYVFNGAKSLSLNDYRKIQFQEIMDSAERLKKKLGRELDYT